MYAGVDRGALERWGARGGGCGGGRVHPDACCAEAGVGGEGVLGPTAVVWPELAAYALPACMGRLGQLH